jgi:nitrate reductase NapE component
MPTPNAKKRRVNRVKGFAARGRWKKWILLLLLAFLLIPVMQVAVVRFIRVKGFAPRGCRGRNRADVLRVHLAVGERFRFLRWLLNQPARAVEAASRRRELCYISSRSVEAYLL